MILHCMKKTTWEERKNKECWGKRNIEADVFIHCSTVEYFFNIVPKHNSSGYKHIEKFVEQYTL